MNPFTMNHQIKPKETYDSDGTDSPPLSPVIDINSYTRFDTTNEDDSNYRSNPSQHGHSQSKENPLVGQSSLQESQYETQSNTQFMAQKMLLTSSTSSKQLQGSQTVKSKSVKQNDQQLTSSQQHTMIITILRKITRSKKIADQNWSVLSRDEIKVIWKLQRQRASKISNYPSNEKMITEIRIKMRSGFYDAYLREVHLAPVQSHVIARVDIVNQKMSADIQIPVAIRPEPVVQSNNSRKWVQCTDCNQWRKVPDSIDISSLPIDWTCLKTTWDPLLKSCLATGEEDISPLETTNLALANATATGEVVEAPAIVQPVLRLNDSMCQLAKSSSSEKFTEKVAVIMEDLHSRPNTNPSTYAITPCNPASWKSVDHSLNDLLEGNSKGKCQNEYKWTNGVVVRDTNWKNCEDKDLICSLERNSSSFIFSELLKALNIRNNFKPLHIREPKQSLRSNTGILTNVEKADPCIALKAIKNLISQARSTVQCDSSTQTTSPPQMCHVNNQTEIPIVKNINTQTMKSLLLPIQTQTSPTTIISRSMLTLKTPDLSTVDYSKTSAEEIMIAVKPTIAKQLPTAHQSSSSTLTFAAHAYLPIDNTETPNTPRTCRCKSSSTKCLMLYCPCFKAGKLCDDSCFCVHCDNNEKGFTKQAKVTTVIQQDRTDLRTPSPTIEEMSFSSQIFMPRLLLPSSNPRQAPLSTILACESEENRNSPSSSSISSHSSKPRSSDEQLGNKLSIRGRDEQSDSSKCPDLSKASFFKENNTMCNKRGREADMDIKEGKIKSKISRALTGLSIDMVNAPNLDELFNSRKRTVDKRCEDCNSFQIDCACDRNDEIEKNKKKRSRSRKNDPFYSENNPVLKIMMNEKSIDESTKLSYWQMEKTIKVVNLQSEKLYVTLVPYVNNGREMPIIHSFSDMVDPNIKNKLSLGDMLVSINDELLESKNISFNQQVELLRNGTRPCRLGFIEKDY